MGTKKPRFRPMPKKQCEGVDSAWFGYGDSEEHRCTRPATHRATEVIDPAIYGSSEPPRPEKVLMCEHHAGAWVGEAEPEFGIRRATPAYRFRRVTA